MYKIISDIINLGKNYDSSLFENTSLDSLIGGNLQQPHIVVYEDNTSKNILLCMLLLLLLLLFILYTIFITKII